MADNIQRTRGRGQGYKFDRGGTPTEFGPFIGVVKNNTDAIRAGRLQVYIEQFGGSEPDNPSLWRMVSYVPPFYGAVMQSGTDQGVGDYVGNPQSYGMWFTPPDIDTQVICFFVGGDPNQGYYIGCVPDAGVNHMIPAIGASTKFKVDPNSEQSAYFKEAKQLPVTEINVENDQIDENPKFYDQEKPVHSVVAAVMLQQGLINDVQRGPITSNSQRESPSAVYGISTPGRPIFQNGVTDEKVRQQVADGNAKIEDFKVIGRRGGHSFVMDDGNLEGKDNLVRIRTSKGHQITMSDDGDFFYIIHANGQTWIELGSEGTVDVYSTNSVNVRTEGDINLHADKNINLFAGESLNIKSKIVRINGDEELSLAAKAKMVIYGEGEVGVRADGTLSLSSKGGGWDGGNSLAFKGGTIDLNGGPSPGKVEKPTLLADVTLPDTVFKSGTGWQVEQGKIKTIVTRAPTHEPYPYHNKGVEVSVELDEGGGDSAGSSLSPETTTTVSSLDTLPVTTPVTPAQILKQPPATRSIGNLGPQEVTGLMSSTAAQVNQPFTQVGVTSGVGRYGFTPAQLEAVGLIKPGTVSQYFRGPGGSTAALLSNPTIWTGKNNVNSVNSLLNNPQLQGRLQQDLLQKGFQSLQKKGVVLGTEPVQQLAPLIQSASRFGPNQVAAWTKGTSNPALVAGINEVSKNAQQAVSVVLRNAGFGSFGGGGGSPTGSVNTVSRNAVNSAVAAVIGNAKVPIPLFTNPAGRSQSK